MEWITHARSALDISAAIGRSAVRLGGAALNETDDIRWHHEPSCRPRPGIPRGQRIGSALGKRALVDKLISDSMNRPGEAAQCSAAVISGDLVDGATGEYAAVFCCSPDDGGLGGALLIQQFQQRSHTVSGPPRAFVCPFVHLLNIRRTVGLTEVAAVDRI